jgi:hypothetical protein
LGGEALVEEHAQGKQIGARGDGLTGGLLGRHVLWRAGVDREVRRERPRFVFRRAFDVGARDPEIEQLHVAVGRDHHVAGFHVAVHQSAGVRVGEAFGDLTAQLEDLRQRQRAPLQHRRQRFPVDELHHDERVGRRLQQFVHLADVGWSSEAAASASVRRRPAAPGTCIRRSSSALMATDRFNCVSVAL